MREIAKKLKISYNGVYYSLQRTAHNRALTRIEREVGGPGAQLSKRTSTLEFCCSPSLRNRRLTGPQLAASLNGTCKTPVSTSTVKIVTVRRMLAF